MKKPKKVFYAPKDEHDDDRAAWEFTKALSDIINEERAKQGLPPMKPSKKLRKKFEGS